VKDLRFAKHVANSNIACMLTHILRLFPRTRNPSTDLQAMSRVWRDGQTSTVFIYRFLCTSTIDEKIYQRQIRKAELSASVMGSGEAGSASVERNFDSGSLKKIFTYVEDTNCETRDILKKTKKQLQSSAKQQKKDLDNDASSAVPGTSSMIQLVDDFHEDLSSALDPLLRTLPRNLISAFLNRVSSEEENRKALEVIARKQAKEKVKGAGVAGGGEEAKCDGEEESADEEEDGDSEPTSKKRKAEPDDDDEEAEYDFVMAPAALSTTVAAPSSAGPAAASSSSDMDDYVEISAEEEAFAAAQMDTEEEPFQQEQQAPRSGGKPKKRRRLIADDDDDGDGAAVEVPSSATPPRGQPSAPTPSVEPDEDMPDWMNPPSNTAATSTPTRALESPLDSAAMSIAPASDDDTAPAKPSSHKKSFTQWSLLAAPNPEDE
jgi:hypothetical protein